MLLSTVAMIIQILPGILQSAGVITPTLSSLIAQLAGTIPALVNSIVTRQPAPEQIISILDAFQNEIAILRTSTALDPEALADAATLDLALSAALQAYVDAGKVTDPSTLTPLPTNL